LDTSAKQIPLFLQRFVSGKSLQRKYGYRVQPNNNLFFKESLVTGTYLLLEAVVPEV
jgi:hypothetical protein